MTVHKHIARGIAAVVAGAALSAAGASGAGPPGTAAAAAQVARVGSAGTSPGAAPSGARLWIAHYNGPAGTESRDPSMAVSPDGTRVFVTGGSAPRGAESQQFATVGYKTATGARLWSRRYTGPGSLMGKPSAVAVSPDGSTVYVTGTIKMQSTDGDFATIAYHAATGTVRWIARYDRPGSPSDDAATAVAVSPDGKTVFVTGSSFSPGRPGGGGSTTIAYRASTGARRWIAHYLGGDRSVAVAVSPGGGKVIVTGSNQKNDYATVAYRAADGTRLWARHHDGPAGARVYGGATALAFSPNGRTVLVTGDSHGTPDSGTTYATIAYRATDGTQLWAVSDSPLVSTGGASSVGVSPDGRTVFVTGNDYVTVAYRAATGTQLWASPSLDGNGPGTGAQLRVASRSPGGYATTLAVSPDGRKVFVTGIAFDPSSGNGIRGFTAVAYGAATGARLWVNRYQGPRNLGGYGEVVAVSPDGRRVFVAGITAWFIPHSQANRITIIAYRA
jgi:DNA-binding beta-propeller fold protein YncE